MPGPEQEVPGSTLASVTLRFETGYNALLGEQVDSWAVPKASQSLKL